MWDAIVYMKEIQTEDGQHYGYKFTCPKCTEKLLVRTIPYDKELRKRTIETYKYDPEDNRWDEKGSLDDGTLSISPSIVCVNCEQGGHYWVRGGKILNC